MPVSAWAWPPCAWKTGALPVEDGLDQFLRAGDAVGHLGLNDRLAVKTGHIHFCIRSDDDSVLPAAISACVKTFFLPPEPLVSTLMVTPICLAFSSRLSAAM